MKFKTIYFFEEVFVKKRNINGENIKHMWHLLETGDLQDVNPNIDEEC